MKRKWFSKTIFGLLVVAVDAVSAGGSLTIFGSSAASIATLVPPGADASPIDVEHRRQLDTCREGLLDPDARDEELRRWADLLLSYDTNAAHALVVELLKRNDRPRVQRVLCDVIGDRSRVAPERISEAYAAPLLDLLGADDPTLRTAAAQTLADFPGPDVPMRLGKIAAGTETPLEKRLAAIDALAPNTHRREVVAQLIPLLDAEAPQIVERTLNALAPAALRSFGNDRDKWRAWWEVRSKWREQDWLAEQLEIYRRRARQLADEFAAFRKQTQQSRAAIEAQYRAFQQEVFRLLPPEQREPRLVEWLDSPMALTNRTALAIIQARIADEGKRPEGQVLEALLRLLDRATDETLRDAIQIVQTLNAPEVVDAVLKLLDRVYDPKTRLVVFSAVGRLASPRAVPALIREIADRGAHPDCVREAAYALGVITAQSENDPPELLNAVAPLKQRYAALEANDVAMRAALLTAMAGVGTPDFIPELLEALESNDPSVLEPALRGLIRQRETSRLARFRTLTAHPDPRVRLAAVQAVAALGTEDADLENLLTRLNPAIEPNASVREAAWRGFTEYMQRRPASERVRAADRLRDNPELELRYLTRLADELAASDDLAVEHATALERLAASLMKQGKFVEAAARWLQLYDTLTARDSPKAFDAAVRGLEAKLRAPAAGELAPLLARLVKAAANSEERRRLRETVERYLGSPEFTADLTHARAVLAELRTAAPPDWSDMMDRAEQTLSEKKPAAPSTP